MDKSVFEYEVDEFEDPFGDCQDCGGTGRVSDDPYGDGGWEDCLSCFHQRKSQNQCKLIAVPVKGEKNDK